MDRLDFEILRAMSPGGEARFWASRRLVDPRITARAIGDQVGISETGARMRLRALAERGYLRGSEVWPNPSLFDVSIVTADLPVRTGEEAARLLEELALVDGVTFARDLMDEEDRRVRVYFVSDTPQETARRSALLKRLTPRGGLRGPTPYWVPPCESPLTRLDWKILRALRARPDAPLRELAELLGVGLKTTARRYHHLLETRACWWTSNALSEEVPAALLAIACRGPAERAEVARAIVPIAAPWMPVAADGFGVPPSENSSDLVGLVLFETPRALEATVRRVQSVAGVVAVRRSFALGSASFPRWFDARIAERLGPEPGMTRRPTTGRSTPRTRAPDRGTEGGPRSATPPG